jgi:hypothetical protein
MEEKVSDRFQDKPVFTIHGIYVLYSLLQHIGEICQETGLDMNDPVILDYRNTAVTREFFDRLYRPIVEAIRHHRM